MRKKLVSTGDKYRYIVENSEKMSTREISKATGFKGSYIYNILSKARMFGLHVREKKRGIMKTVFQEIKDKQNRMVKR